MDSGMSTKLTTTVTRMLVARFTSYSTSAAALEAFCKDNLAGYKRPRRFVFGPLPRTATGKIQKFVLRAHAADTIAAETVA